MNKEGDLRVWWIPNPPRSPFHYDVKSTKEAMIVLDTLSKFDLDVGELIFANAGGLEEFIEMEDEDWSEWYDEETGDDIKELQDIRPKGEVLMNLNTDIASDVLYKYKGYLVYNGIL